MGCQCLKGGDQVAPSFEERANAKKDIVAELPPEATMTKQQLNQQANAGSMTESKKLDDFNETGDDVAKIKEDDLAKYNRYMKFEKSFPWYQMDVNGYIYRIKQAMQKEMPEFKDRLEMIHHISIETMIETFKVHPAWNDLSDPDSKLRKFLKSEFMDDDHDSKLSVHKLRAIAILWCDGDPKEKVVELYENMQDAMQTSIAASDRDFQPNLFAVLNTATEMVFRLEPEYMDGAVREISEEKVKEVQATYDEEDEGIADTFLDEIFGYDSQMSQKQWEKSVAQKYAWIFDSDKIREKLYGIKH